MSSAKWRPCCLGLNVLIRKRKDRVYGKWKYKVPKSTKSYLKSENNNKTNRNTSVTIYINRYCQHIFLYDEEKLFSVLSNLQTNLFRKDLQKNGPTYRGQVVNPRPQTQQGQPITKHETPHGGIEAESTLAHVIACCLMIPSHYPNKCWLLTSENPGQSTENNFTNYMYYSA